MTNEIAGGFIELGASGSRGTLWRQAVATPDGGNAPVSVNGMTVVHHGTI